MKPLAQNLRLSPKVSVILPAYNAMDFLPQAVSSVLAQTFADFELIIINDGSSDNIESWAHSLHDRRIKFVSQINSGPASARNNGLRNALGDYIAFIDADDIWVATKLEKQVNLLAENPEMGLVYSWISLIDEAGKRQGKLRKNSVRGNVWLDLTVHNIVECGSVALVRGECFEAVGGFDERQAIAGSEDWDMWLRIAAHYGFGLIEEPLVNYRCHTNNLSSHWRQMAKSFELVLQKAFDTAPVYLQAYKNRSYGFAKLRTAWKALQHSEGDYKDAIAMEKEAIACYPAIKRTREYLKFKSALIFVQLFGLQPYSACRRAIYRIKDRTVQLVRGARI